MIRISTGRRGTMIRARGKRDEHRLMELFSLIAQEKAEARTPITTLAKEPPRAEGNDATEERCHG